MHDMVIRVFVEDMKGGRHVSPCVFSSEEKAHEWCRRFGTNVVKTFQFLRVDVFYTEADKTSNGRK